MVDKYDISMFIDKPVLERRIAILATKAEWKAEQDKIQRTVSVWFQLF